MKLNKSIFLVLGPLLFVILQQLDPPAEMPESAYDILCATLWIALWWVTEVVPIAVTALLPIILFPLMGAVDISTTTASYGHKYVFLYLGGFISLAIFAVVAMTFDPCRRQSAANSGCRLSPAC